MKFTSKNPIVVFSTFCSLLIYIVIVSSFTYKFLINKEFIKGLITLTLGILIPLFFSLVVYIFFKRKEKTMYKITHVEGSTEEILTCKSYI